MAPIPVPSSPMVLDKESLSQQQWCSADTGPSSACIDIVYPPSFQQFNVICPGMGFQAFLRFQVFSAFWRWRFMSLIFHIWEVCTVIALRGLQPHSPPHLWDPGSMGVAPSAVFSPDTLFIFFPFVFSPLSRWANTIDLSLSPVVLPSVVSMLLLSPFSNSGFSLLVIPVSFRMSTSNFSLSVGFPCLPSFSFKRLWNCIWSTSMMTTLKLFSADPHVRLSSVLASVGHPGQSTRTGESDQRWSHLSAPCPAWGSESCLETSTPEMFSTLTWKSQGSPCREGALKNIQSITSTQGTRPHLALHWVSNKSEWDKEQLL